MKGYRIRSLRVEDFGEELSLSQNNQRHELINTVQYSFYS